MSAAIAAVVFDMDGLMLDTEPLYQAAWQQATAELGCELTDAAYLRLVGLREEESELELVAEFGDGFPLDAFRARWPEIFRAGVDTEGIVVKDGLVELLAFVEQRGLMMAVATSSHRHYAELSLRRSGLDIRFAVVVTGDESARAKPAPDIYLEAARRLGVTPSQCIAIEDSDHGILAAHAAGMVPLLVPDLKPPSPAAVAAAHRVLPSLRAVPAVIADLLAP